MCLDQCVEAVFMSGPRIFLLFFMRGSDIIIYIVAVIVTVTINSYKQSYIYKSAINMLHLYLQHIFVTSIFFGFVMFLSLVR